MKTIENAQPQKKLFHKLFKVLLESKAVGKPA